MERLALGIIVTRCHSPSRRDTRLTSLALLTLVSLALGTFSTWAQGSNPTAVLLAHGATTLTSQATTDDWPMYQHDLQRSGTSSDTTISPGTASQLRPLWTYQTGDTIVAEPAISGGVAYVGSWDGYEYAFNTSTGQLLWQTWLGTTGSTDCSTTPIGVSSSATVQNGMVYVGGGDSYWYALNATDGSVAWRVFVGDNSAAGGHYNWSSPAIYNGYAYVGIASFGDCPLVQGQVLQISLTTHQIVNTFNLVPNGQTGAGVWGSPAIDTATGTVYVATGNANLGSGYYGQAIVALDVNTLTLKSFWQVPASQLGSDSDFGATPLLFTDGTGRHLVAVANKNGVIYALDRANISAGPVWQTQIAYGGDCPDCGDGSISSMTFANNQVYAAGGDTIISGIGYGGSVNALNPTTGAFIWRRGEVEATMTPLTYDNGMLFNEPGSVVEALNATSGARLFSYNVGATYDGVSIANGQIVFGSWNGTIYDLALPATPPSPPPDANCPTGWTCQDIGAPSASGSETISGVTSGSTWTISADGVGATGTSDQFRFLSKTTNEPSQVMSRAQAPGATSSAAQAGVMFRQAVDANSPFYALYLAPNGTVTVRYRSAFGGATSTLSTDVSTSGSTPIYLEIQRSHDYYSASTSTDGVHFTLIPGTTKALPMPDQLMSGIFASSGVNGTLGSAMFSAISAGALTNMPAPAPSAHACPTDWSCQDIGNGRPVGDQTVSNGVWSVSGGGYDIARFELNDQFHYVWQTVSGDGTFSAHVTSQTNTDPNAKAGIMARLSTDPAAAFYAIFVTPGSGVTVYYRTSNGARIVALDGASGITTPIYLRIVRSGATFVGYYSSDNVTWTAVPSSAATLPDLSGSVLAGLMVNSLTSSTLSVATFDSVASTFCLSSWQCADIGAPALTGGQSSSYGTLTVQGAGADIWSSADQFHFAWRSLLGDGALSAQVLTQTNTSAWAKAGVMLRLSSDPSAPFYDVVVTPSNGVVAQWRTASGALAQTTAGVAGVVAPTWVKIVRSGTTYSGYYSTDGQAWTLIPGSTVTIATLTGMLQSGLAVTSHNTSAPGAATFAAVAQITTLPSLLH